MNTMLIDTQADKTPAQAAEASAYIALKAERERLIRLASSVPSEYPDLPGYRQDLIAAAESVADLTEKWDTLHAAL